MVFFDWGKAFSQTFPSRMEPSDSHSGTWKLGNKFTRDVFARLVHKVPPKRSAPKKTRTMKNCKRLIGAGEPKWGFKPLMLLSQVLPRIFDVHPPKKNLERMIQDDSSASCSDGRLTMEILDSVLAPGEKMWRS